MFKFGNLYDDRQPERSFYESCWPLRPERARVNRLLLEEPIQITQQIHEISSDAR